jgi:hypothetical protein
MLYFFTDSNSGRTGGSVTSRRPEAGKDARTLGFQVGISLKRIFQLTTGKILLASLNIGTVKNYK